MYLSKFFFKSKKEIKDTVSSSINRLIRGSFLHQESSGIFSFLPLGLRILKKLNLLIEKEMNKISINIELPILQSVDLWKKSNRYDTYGKETLKFFDRNQKEFLIPPTCEEAFFNLFHQFCKSYKDLPKSLYQIGWKFRDEIRPRGGLLRSRLFLMKDSYSFGKNEEEAHEAYINHYNTYVNIFNQLELEVFSILSDSGEIGGDLTHEFVTINEEGDGFAYLNQTSKKVKNIKEIKEISGDFKENSLYKKERIIELAQIFYYDIKYSQKMESYFINEKGNNNFYYGGCYGIGITRLLGVLSKKKYWPKKITPFDIYLISISSYESKSQEIYDYFNNKDILYDDRKISFGEKIHDMYLIGIPLRIIVGKNIELYWQDEEVEICENISILEKKINFYIK